ncbi:PR domain zinc finger protein 14 [Pezoporus wallicus]|uniref:PR domain zinc finger protein 14 n=1 Tax=Pezoporus wallicus TaxID=35540 RepID=UPI00254CA8A1|nr:PR domain zinc finger protein 14 [Pezoporus wallicus]
MSFDSLYPNPTPGTPEIVRGSRGSVWGARRPPGLVLTHGIWEAAEPPALRPGPAVGLGEAGSRAGGRGGGSRRLGISPCPSDTAGLDLEKGGQAAPAKAATPPRSRGLRSGQPPSPTPRAARPPGRAVCACPPLSSLPSPAHIAAGSAHSPRRRRAADSTDRLLLRLYPTPQRHPQIHPGVCLSASRQLAPYLLPFPPRPDMALYLAGELVPGDYRDELGTAYYLPFHPPAQYFEAAPDFFQPLKSLGGMLPASPPLPQYSFSRAPTFLSQPPPLPAEPFPGLPLPHYTKPQDPFSPKEDSLVGAGALGSPAQLYLSPPHKAARSPEAGAPEGQNHRYHFTEEELNTVLYGALRSSQLAGSIHAISGPRLPPASTGKGVPGLCARGCLRKRATEEQQGGRSFLAAGCTVGSGDSPQSGVRVVPPEPCPPDIAEGTSGFISPAPLRAQQWPSRAQRALFPAGLSVLQVEYGDLSQVGVFCTDPIPKGVRFGPFQGKVVSISEIKIYDDNSLMWEIFECGRLSHFIDGKGASGNWMSLVNCARFPEEQNLTAIQCEGQIFYESCKEILPKQELLVWYGDCYVQFLGIPISLKDGEERKKHPEDPEEAGESFKCDRCGKVFAYKYYRDKHLKYTRCVDQGDRKFPCNLCNRSFEKRDRLRIHVLHVHERHRPHKCSECGKSFSQSSSLSKHMRVHSGERPYKCVYCNKAFTASSILRTHIRQHSGEKPFKCKYCGKVFASHAAHDSHVRRMHSKEECTCSVCGVHFLGQEDYQVHLKMHDAY